jgi:hypothetical protein
MVLGLVSYCFAFPCNAWFPENAGIHRTIVPEIIMPYSTIIVNAFEAVIISL